MNAVNASLPRFSIDLLVKDVGNLAPLIAIVVILAVASIIVWVKTNGRKH